MDDTAPKSPKLKLFDTPHHNVKSRKQEDNLAKKLGGKRQKASGAVTHHRGDVICKDLLFENKRTDKDSFSIKKEWLVKISQEALVTNRVPGLNFEFGEIEQLVEKSWVAVPSNFFAELMECYRAMGEKDADDESKKSG